MLPRLSYILEQLCPSCQLVVTAEWDRLRKARKEGMKQQREACKRARRIHLQGATIEEVAEMFEVPIGRAERMVLPGGQQGWRRNQTPLDVGRLQRLLDEGCKPDEIALALGCSPGTVYKWKRRLDELSEWAGV